MPFGVFVELDQDIQGLAHLVELSHGEVKDANEVVKEGEEREFKVISIEPGEHRLGLSIKQLTPAPKKDNRVEEVVESVVEKKIDHEEPITEQNPPTDEAIVE